jgi:hypothetical protein
MRSGAGEEVQQFATKEFMVARIVGDYTYDGLRLVSSPFLVSGKEAGDITELFPGGHRFRTLGGKTGGEGRVESDHPAAAVRCAVGHGDEIGIGRDPGILRGRRIHPNGGCRAKRGGEPNRPAVRIDPRHSGGPGTGPAAGSTGHAYTGPFSLDQRNSARSSGRICNLQPVLTCARFYTIELRPLIDQKVVDRRPA